MKKVMMLITMLCLYSITWGQSIEEIREKAMAGDPKAQVKLGDSYMFGRNGLTKNEEEGLKWYKKAAAQNYDMGSFALGSHYFAVFLVNSNSDKDKQEAIYWLKKSLDDSNKSGEDDGSTAKCLLKELGVTYHPGKKTSATTSTASSQSNSSSSGKLLYSGVYTESSQGYSPDFGWTSTPGPDFTVGVEIYNDYIIVSGSRYDYDKTSGAWRIYGGNEFWGSYHYYHVNSSTYEMKHIMSSHNPYTGGYNDFQYAMTKGETTMPKYSNGNSNSGANGITNNSRSNSTQNSSGSSSSNRRACAICKFTNGKCTTCKGSGQVLSTAYGTKSYTRCTDCGGNGRCKYCNGTGYRQ